MIVTREPCANGSRPFRESEAAILKPQEAGREKSWPVFLYVVWAGVPEAQYRFCKPTCGQPRCSAFSNLPLRPCRLQIVDRVSMGVIPDRLRLVRNDPSTRRDCSSPA